MALVTLYDPYEWFDPEQGRVGILVHSSIFDRGPWPATPTYVEGDTWEEVWDKLAQASSSGTLSDP
jgi:hypothetical protein